jgi:actin-related protein
MNSATLSLLSTGNTSGLVIESGEGVTSVVPIYEVIKKILVKVLIGENLKKKYKKIIFQQILNF